MLMLMPLISGGSFAHRLGDGDPDRLEFQRRVGQVELDAHHIGHLLLCRRKSRRQLGRILLLHQRGAIVVALQLGQLVEIAGDIDAEQRPLVVAVFAEQASAEVDRVIEPLPGHDRRADRHGDAAKERQRRRGKRQKGFARSERHRRNETERLGDIGIDDRAQRRRHRVSRDRQEFQMIDGVEDVLDGVGEAARHVARLADQVGVALSDIVVGGPERLQLLHIVVDQLLRRRHRDLQLIGRQRDAVLRCRQIIEVGGRLRKALRRGLDRDFADCFDGRHCQ